MNDVGYARGRIPSAQVLTLVFGAALLLTSTSCIEVCSMPSAGYWVHLIPVDEATGRRVDGLAVEIALENADGAIGEPGTGVTRGDGTNIEIGDGSLSQFIETDVSEEEVCMTLDIPGLAAALQGIGSGPNLVRPEDLEVPPVPTRAVFTVTVDGVRLSTAVEITDEMIAGCQQGGTMCNLQFCTVPMNLGS